MFFAVVWVKNSGAALCVLSPSFTIHPKFLSPSDTTSASPGGLLGVVSKTLITAKSEPLATIHTSVWGCCTCPFTVKMQQGKGVPGVVQMDYVSSIHISSCPHFVTAASWDLA